MHTLDNADRPYLDILPCVDHVSRQSQNHLHDQLSSAWVSEAALCGTLLILFCHFWKHLWLFWHNSRNEKQAINPCNLKKYSITSLPRGFTQIFYRGRRGDVRQRLIFYTPKKSQLQSLSTQKNPCVFSMPKTVLHQCSVNCYYVIVDLSWWKVLTNPKKTLRFFSRPQKIPASFIDPKLPFWPKFQTPPPPVSKYESGAPRQSSLLIRHYNNNNNNNNNNNYYYYFYLYLICSFKMIYKFWNKK